MLPASILITVSIVVDDDDDMTGHVAHDGCRGDVWQCSVSLVGVDELGEAKRQVTQASLASGKGK